MTAVEKCQAERSRISEALKLAGVAEILYNKDNIPRNLPCAILILDSETGKHGTAVGARVKKSAFSMIKSEVALIVLEEMLIKTEGTE